MRSTWGAVLLSSLLVGVEAVPAANAPYFQVVRNGYYALDIVDQLEEATMPKVEAWMAKKAGKTNCTLENAAVRREWSDLSVEQREEYIRAVQCLMKKPPQSPRDLYPGALNRYDDFVAFHMTNAGILHDTTHLFASHKYFIWAYERALREECGYTGYQPYMNYDRYAQDPIHSPMFNGNASSMGGNGGFTANYSGVPQPGKTPNLIKSGRGGGCVTEGPFKDMVVNLGPKGTVLPDVPKNPREDGLGSNPRCLRRDVNRNSALGATANYTYSLIMNYTDINGFYNRYLGLPPLKNDQHPWGLHTAGHYIHGGDPGGDFYCSPGDPAFYFHHGMLDRVWWLWQMQDPENRVGAIPSLGGGASPHSHTIRDDGPPMHDMGHMDPADSIVDLGWVAGPVRLGDLNDQLGGNGGQFCYVYV